MVSGSGELYGSDRVLLEAVAGLLDGGHRVVFAAGADGPLLERAAVAGARTMVVPSPVLRRSYLSPAGLVRFAAEIARTVPGMVALIRRARPDVVYANTNTLTAWTLAARAVRVPVVVHVHEAEAGQAAPLRRVLASALQAATAVIFNSETSRSLAEADAVGPLPAHSVILNPVPTPTPHASARTEMTAPLRLLYVGRISHRKGVDVAVEALGRLVAEGRDVTLDVVGDVFPGYEPFFDALRLRVSELDLADRVTFHGFCSDVGPFLAAADICLVPSRQDESFGNVLVEAVLAGRPVVAAAQNGLQEAGSGLASVRYVPAGDEVALAAAVAAIADDWQAVPEATAQSRESAVTRHDPQMFREAVVRELARVASAPRRRP